MIYEERDYRLRPGQLGRFVAAYEKDGLPLQREHLGGLVGYFTTEIGELNHVVSLWSYASLDDRMARRGRMLADPRWQDYLLTVTALIDLQQTRILLPSGFSPLQ